MSQISCCKCLDVHRDFIIIIFLQSINLNYVDRTRRAGARGYADTPNTPHSRAAADLHNRKKNTKFKKKHKIKKKNPHKYRIDFLWPCVARRAIGRPRTLQI